MNMHGRFRRLSGVIGITGLVLTLWGASVAAERLEGKPVPMDSIKQPSILEPINPPTTSPAMPIPEPTTNLNPPPEVGKPDRLDGKANEDWDTGRNERRNEHRDRGRDFPLELLIPIFAITLGVGGPIALLALLMILNFRNKRRREAHINLCIDKLIAAGRDIPIELLRGDEPPSVTAIDRPYLDKGIRDIFLGLAIFVALSLLTNINTGSLALILVALGVSRVVIWKFAQHKTFTPQE